jgi:hypothetical protein
MGQGSEPKVQSTFRSRAFELLGVTAASRSSVMVVFNQIELLYRRHRRLNFGRTAGAV